MMETKKIGDLYTDFVRIDLDARGGYARVAQTKIVNRPDFPDYCAFKIMRHELENHQKGMDRFEVELQTFIKIFKDKNFPLAITKIFDSGFVDSRVSNVLQKPRVENDNTRKIENIDPEWKIISTGGDLNAFLEEKAHIKGNTAQWLPYIAVELAPYGNSLLRQIHKHSADPTSYSNLFPVGEVVSMALQLLDVMEYLQQHELAYMDWKPEHIYWDNQTQKVKLIDWNVTNMLQNNGERKNIIREDIRLFCGAALYCSMALSDPEDMQKPIGPEPKLSNNSASFLRQRYLTNDPNFYERGAMFDDDIKQLVKKGLDPFQGFDTPQEVKNALKKYAEKNLNSPGSVNSSTRPLIGGIPRDAAQHYRQARSYISAGDLQLALASLRRAVETAQELGVEFTDAKKVLKTVQSRLYSDKLKQEARIAAENKNWKIALDLYDKALKQDPTNIITSKDLAIVQNILYAGINELQTKGFLKFFGSLRKLRNIAEAVKNVSGYDSSLMKSVESQLNQTKLIQSGSIIISLLGIILILYFNGLTVNLVPVISMSNTPSATLPVDTPVISTHFPTITSKPFISSTPSITITSTITSTNTLTPIPVVGIGYINKVVASAWNEPNKGLHTKLGLHQPLELIEQRVVSNSTWFRCKWEINGVTDEGWILSDNITLGNTPTPSQ